MEEEEERTGNLRNRPDGKKRALLSIKEGGGGREGEKEGGREGKTCNDREAGR